MAHLHLVNTVNFMIWVVIENSFVIIAASIPLLRPLFSSRYSKSKNSNTPSGYNAGSASYELGSRNVVMSKEGNRARSRVKSMPLASDSEENILGFSVEGGVGMGGEGEGIRKEVSVQVRYEGAKPRERM